MPVSFPSHLDEATFFRFFSIFICTRLNLIRRTSYSSPASGLLIEEVEQVPSKLVKRRRDLTPAGLKADSGKRSTPDFDRLRARS